MSNEKRTALDEADDLHEALRPFIDGLRSGMDASQEQVDLVQRRMAAYRTVRDLEVREHAKRWDDDTEVAVTIQIRVGTAADVPLVLTDVRKDLKTLIAQRAQGPREIQWCSSAVRVLLDWNPDVEPEPAPQAPAVTTEAK